MFIGVFFGSHQYWLPLPIAQKRHQYLEIMLEKIDEYGAMNRLICNDGRELYNLMLRLKTDKQAITVQRVTRNDTV